MRQHYNTSQSLLSISISPFSLTIPFLQIFRFNHFSFSKVSCFVFSLLSLVPSLSFSINGLFWTVSEWSWTERRWMSGGVCPRCLSYSLLKPTALSEEPQDKSQNRHRPIDQNECVCMWVFSCLRLMTILVEANAMSSKETVAEENPLRRTPWSLIFHNMQSLLRPCNLESTPHTPS